MGYKKISMQDQHQIAQMAYNDAERSIDVSIASDLIPPRYDRVEYSYDVNFDVDYVSFYGNGQRATAIIYPNEFKVQGLEEIIAVNIEYKANGSYFTIYDDLGSVAVVLDDSNSTPVVPGDRIIYVDILPTDSFSQIAIKTQNTLNLDAKFSALANNNNVFINYVNFIQYPDATSDFFDVSIIQDGYYPISNNSILLDSVFAKYRVWFNVNGNGVDPTLPGEISVEVVLSSDDDFVAKLIDVIDGLEEFLCFLNEDENIEIIFHRSRANSSINGHSLFYSTKLTIPGKDMGLVGKIAINRTNGFITSQERLV